MILKHIILIYLIGSTTTNLFSQDKKDLSISLGTGILNSPYYTNSKPRQFYNFDFTYNITQRHTIATSFLAGKHLYYDSISSNNAVPLNTPGYEKSANATADYLTFSIFYKYQLYRNKTFSITAGAGAGIMTQIMEYPYEGVNTASLEQSSWTDIVFPVRLEFDCKLSKHFKLGLIGGLFIHPDFPILAYHAGPRLFYILK